MRNGIINAPGGGEGSDEGRGQYTGGATCGTQVLVESTSTTSHRHGPGTSGPHHPQGRHPDGRRRRRAWSPVHRHTQQLLGMSGGAPVLGRVPGGRTASTQGWGTVGGDRSREPRVQRPTRRSCTGRVNLRLGRPAWICTSPGQGAGSQASTNVGSRGPPSVSQALLASVQESRSRGEIIKATRLVSGPLRPRAPAARKPRRLSGSSHRQDGAERDLAEIGAAEVCTACEHGPRTRLCGRDQTLTASGLSGFGSQCGSRGRWALWTPVGRAH